jgi:hypothetical protein
VAEVQDVGGPLTLVLLVLPSRSPMFNGRIERAQGIRAEDANFTML